MTSPEIEKIQATTNTTYTQLRFSHHQCTVQHFECFDCNTITLVYSHVPNTQDNGLK